MNIHPVDGAPVGAGSLWPHESRALRDMVITYTRVKGVTSCKHSCPRGDHMFGEP
jgi:hypothetical protein